MERTTENYISLYNTVGLIERDKNIYFVPHQADIYAKRTAQRTKVCDCYIELFNTVLSFSSRYHDIKISQWTPEDRSLVIEGTIDDFRQSRGRGLALNYLIVRRTVSDEESGDVTSNHYYFAYFIDSVEQRGNNSVRLSLTPDHFTNLYYLNNEDTLTSTYDPFNPIMKNCFVERQHYDRFKEVHNLISFTGTLANKWLKVLKGTNNVTGTFYLASESDINICIRSLTDNSIVRELPNISRIDEETDARMILRDSGNQTQVIQYIDGVETIIGYYRKNVQYVSIKSNDTDYTFSNTLTINQYIEDKIGYNNLERILSSEESFKYKYQYKDKRFPLPLRNVDFNYFSSLLDSLKEITSFQDFSSFINGLDDNYKKAIFDLFISYLNVILTENILLPNAINNPNICDYFKYGYGNHKGVSVPFTHIAIPFVNIPNGFENIKKEWFKICVDLWYSGSTEQPVYTTINTIEGDDLYSPTRILDYLANTGGSQYVLTTYVSRYSSLSKNIKSIDLENNKYALHLLFDLNVSEKVYVSSTSDSETIAKANSTLGISKNFIGYLPFKKVESASLFGAKYVLDLRSGLYIQIPIGGSAEISGLFNITSGLVSYNTQAIWRQAITDTGYPIDGYDFNSRMLFVIGDNEFDEINVDFNDKEIVLNSYVDPLTNSDPYSFYSISLNEVEQIISKTRVIESYNSSFSFKLKPILSYNDSYKVGLIPSYYINSKWNRYYTESIVTVISSQVPIINDSWLTYYVQNKAQMKNQYAVQQNNYESGRDQAWVNMGASTMEGIIKGGSYGFGGMAVGGITGAVKGISGLINNAISNKYQVENITLSQKAKMADMGAKPDSIKLSGSDILYSLQESELGFYVNHYTIDEVSYNSICKTLERLGYMVNVYDSLNIFDRVGLNYLKVTSFDFVEDNFVLSEEQMNAVSSIFAQGVTLLHDKDFLHNLGDSGYHNIETALKEVI